MDLNEQRYTSVALHVVLPWAWVMGTTVVEASEIPIVTVREGTTATQMAQNIFGSGVTVTGATYTGDIDSAGIYSNGGTVSPGDTGVILSTGDAESFTNSTGTSNQRTHISTNTPGPNNATQLNAEAGSATYDASILDIDFIPDSGLLTMQFIFSSEEYPEFQNSIYQDFVGVWINGQLVEVEVEVEVGNGDTDPGNINTTNNINMYVDNGNDDYNTEIDGFTITMTLTMVVNPGVVNSMRIAIADVADSSYDSNLLIAGNSVQSDLIAVTDNVNVYPDGTTTLNVLDNDINETGGTLTITCINGQPASVGGIVILPTGQFVTLNADATFSIDGDDDSENFNFTYTIDNGTATDVGFVNATSVPCFVAGTMIATPMGEVAAETLRPGDLVMTKDDGPQPLRWIGSRTVAALGDFAPIHIRANAIGQHRDLLVSPLHRVLIRDNLAELLFGEAEVLVMARDLVNNRSVTRRSGGEVTYVHLLFDEHQVVFSEGLETESFLPGPQTPHSFEASMVGEICTIFPELDLNNGAGLPCSARRTLRRFDVQLLRDTRAA